MGRVRTKTVKKAARVIVEKYYAKLTLDFQMNKKIAEEVATIPSKRLRNKIAGFTTHLMKRIQRGPVRGISLKLQEEERERRMDFVPERSEVDVEVIQVVFVIVAFFVLLSFPVKIGISESLFKCFGHKRQYARDGSIIHSKCKLGVQTKSHSNPKFF